MALTASVEGAAKRCSESGRRYRKAMLGVWRKEPECDARSLEVTESDARSLEEGARMRCTESGGNGKRCSESGGRGQKAMLGV